MKSQKITTQKKKEALDKFDRDNFSDNRSADSEVLNQVGKINVGWNINYLRTLPKPSTIIDIGSADDFQVLHDAHPDAYSIFIDPNKKYEEIYKKYLLKKKVNTIFVDLVIRRILIIIISIQKNHIYHP